MPKRLTDTNLWAKEWFVKLPDLQRTLFLYIKDNCDCAGIFEPNYTMLNFIFHTQVTQEDILAINKFKTQIQKLENGKFFLIGFIKFQYLSPEKPYLNPKNNANLGVIRSLMKNNIDYRKYLAPNEGLVSPCPGALVKDKDKVKVKEKEKEKETYKEKQAATVNPDITFDTLVQKCFDLYKANCPSLIPLGFERRNKDTLALLHSVLVEIDKDVGVFEQICRNAESVKTIVERKIDFKMMLKNYIGLINGKYKEPDILDGIER